MCPGFRDARCVALFLALQVGLCNGLEVLVRFEKKREGRRNDDGKYEISYIAFAVYTYLCHYKFY